MRARGVMLPAPWWAGSVVWRQPTRELVLKRMDNPAEYADRRRHEHRGESTVGAARSNGES